VLNYVTHLLSSLFHPTVPQFDMYNVRVLKHLSILVMGMNLRTASRWRDLNTGIAAR
jgi:hypothetical protein